MPAWLALILTLISAVATAGSVAANIEAKRTGRLRLFFWHIQGWGERGKSPRFFRFKLWQDYYRTGFLALLTVILAAYFLEAISMIE